MQTNQTRINVEMSISLFRIDDIGLMKKYSFNFSHQKLIKFFGETAFQKLIKEDSQVFTISNFLNNEKLVVQNDIFFLKWTL